MAHVRGRRVYISGPMTGIKDWNRAMKATVSSTSRASMPVQSFRKSSSI